MAGKSKRLKKKAALRPDEAMVAVPNPDHDAANVDEPPTVRVKRSLRDPLTKLYHTGRIDDCEYSAGRTLQNLLWLSEVGQPRPGTPKERVDNGCVTGRTPADRQLAAHRELRRVWAMLGKDNSALAYGVLADGKMPEKFAAELRRSSRDDVRATCRCFKWALQSLAVHFGLSSARIAA